MGIMVIGLFLMASSIDIIMLYIAIEVVSIMSFILAAYLKLNTRSNEAGLKYVIYGSFSSGVMLYELKALCMVLQVVLIILKFNELYQHLIVQLTQL